MIPPPAGGGASLSTQQLFVRCPDASLGPAGAVGAREPVEDGPGLRPAGLRQVVG